MPQNVKMSSKTSDQPPPGAVWAVPRGPAPAVHEDARGRAGGDGLPAEEESNPQRRWVSEQRQTFRDIFYRDMETKKIIFIFKQSFRFVEDFEANVFYDMPEPRWDGGTTLYHHIHPNLADSKENNLIILLKVDRSQRASAWTFTREVKRF